ncbi:MAG: glycosyltransferase [Actinomycetota bacterium]|nr:glycosyltransferase [Actinomycetota bacterium]
MPRSVGGLVRYLLLRLRFRKLRAALFALDPAGSVRVGRNDRSRDLGPRRRDAAGRASRAERAATRGQAGVRSRDGLSASVVVVTHRGDRVALVRRCLDSLHAGTVLPKETIVVVDSNPSLEETLRHVLADGRTEIVASSGAGASAARNAALDVATGDIVAYLDDDASPETDWLESLVRAFEQDHSVVGIGGRIDPDYEGDSRLPPELLWLVGCTYRGHREDEGPISRPIGANMAFRSLALARVGGFSSEFGPRPDAGRAGTQLLERKTGSNEELALALQLRRVFGERCLWYWPSARVNHFVPSSRLRPRYILRRLWIEGRTKAAIKTRFGPAAMGDDKRYLVHVLIPAISRSVWTALLRRDRSALYATLLLAAGMLVTGAGYVFQGVIDRVARCTREFRPFAPST